MKITVKISFLKIFGLTLMIFFLSISCSKHTENLIVNGDFEADIEDGRIPGWNFCKYLEKQKVFLEEKNAHNGKRSLAMRIVQSNDPENLTGGKNTLSQIVTISPRTNYVLSLFYKRESSIYGADVRIQLLDDNGKPIIGALYRKELRSPFWTSVQLSFNSGKARKAEIGIMMDSGGSWRISVGRTLWLDEISLVKLDDTGNLQQVKVKNNIANGVIKYTAPSRLYPWIKLKADCPHDIDLFVDDTKHTFRTYTYGKETWIQPVLPDLVVSAGNHEIKMNCDNTGVVLQKLLFTQNPTWQPKDAPEFLPAEEAIEKLNKIKGEGKAGEISLHIDGELPEGRWPVTQGIPFPQGELWSLNDMELLSIPENESKAFQTNVLSRWSDGSIRWLALSLQGKNNEKFVLRYNQPVNKIPEFTDMVKVEKLNNGFNISTGKLSALIPSDGSGILGPVAIQGKTVISNTLLTVNDTYSSRNSLPVITLEENGPLRAVVCIKGVHKNQTGEKMLDYVVRWFFHAGSSRIDLEHIFTQRDSLIEIKIDNINMMMDIPGTGINIVKLGEDREITANPIFGPVILNSKIANDKDAKIADYPYIINQGNNILQRGFRYPGYFAAQGAGVSICGWMQDFWQKGPSEIIISQNNLSIGLVGKPGTMFYTGMSKTSRISFSLSGEKNAVQAYASEPLLLAGPEWYSYTNATGHRFMPFSNGKYYAYDRSMEASMQKWIDETERSAKLVTGAGLLHYGDIVVTYSGVPGTGMNLESALDESSLIQFLRTGDRSVYNYSRIAIDHFIDIDIDHSNVNGGLIWVHRQHNREEVNAGRAGLNGHSWFNGVPHFEMLRASRRIYDVADEVGRYYSRNGFDLEPYIRPWRPIAWQFMSLVKAFEITGKIEYLEAARQSLIVTRHQRDFLIEEWPYMFAVGIKAVRHYYNCTFDPLAKEIYLQIFDGFMRLRDRPDDVVNGEWKKPVNTVLGNFPNDRSCIFYNEGAWSYLLSGDRRHVDNIAYDLNWQVALGVNDPTLLCGSADLLKVMDELGIKATEVSADLPWTFMPSEQLYSRNGLISSKAGVMDFFVNGKKDQDFTIYLFKSSVFKYTIDYEGFARVISPSGREVVKKPISNKGINIFTFDIPGDNETGKYTLEVEFNNIWQWTMQEVIVPLEKGLNSLLLNTRYGHMALDAVGIAPLGRFPWISDDLDYIKVFETENGVLPSSWQVFQHENASDKKYVRETGKSSEPLKLSVMADEKGDYRVFIRVWKPKSDIVELQREGQDKIYRIQQTHDMSNTEFPTWSLNSSLGEDSVVKYW